MNIDILNEAIGNIDPAIVEAALSDGAASANAIPFARKPWMKYAVAAAAVIVVVAAALVAINVSGAWRNGNLVPPNSGNENSGVIASAGSDGGSENPGSVPGSEGTPVINGDSSQNGGNSGSENPGGQSSTPDKPDDTQTPPSEETEVVIEGDFMKDNMPAVTYRIAGESRTFVYQKSSVVKTSESGDGKPTYSVVDRYADSDGAAISVDADTGDLTGYNAGKSHAYFAGLISEKQAAEIAMRFVLNTDIPISVENADVSVRFAEEKYYIDLAVEEGEIEVCLDDKGRLRYMVIDKKADE